LKTRLLPPEKPGGYVHRPCSYPRFRVTAHSRMVAHQFRRRVLERLFLSLVIAAAALGEHGPFEVPFPHRTSPRAAQACALAGVAAEPDEHVGEVHKNEVHKNGPPEGVMAGSIITYCRVSTARQGRSGLGLEAQREALERFAVSESLEIVREFVEVETGKGADALDRRPQTTSRSPRRGAPSQMPGGRGEARPSQPRRSLHLRAHGRARAIHRSRAWRGR